MEVMKTPFTLEPLMIDWLDFPFIYSSVRCNVLALGVSLKYSKLTTWLPVLTLVPGFTYYVVFHWFSKKLSGVVAVRQVILSEHTLLSPSHPQCTGLPHHASRPFSQGCVTRSLESYSRMLPEDVPRQWLLHRCWPTGGEEIKSVFCGHKLTPPFIFVLSGLC